MIERLAQWLHVASPGVDRQRAVHLLERVGLGHRMTHKPTQLSVGEQQRVAVARALANRPKLLLADEPTANVDSGHQQQILDLLSQTCREEQVSLVLVTHSPQVAEQFDRVEKLEEFNRVGRGQDFRSWDLESTKLTANARPKTQDLSPDHPMSLWKIAWRSIQQRSLASLLTAISMALGVMLVVAVLVVYSVVQQAFHRGGEGYNLIVGPPKGSSLDLVLSNVFYVGQPTTTLPYRVYQDLYQSHIGLGVVEIAVPICLGDTYQDKRVVGTTPDMFNELTYYGDRKYEFAEGHNFGENDYFDAVAGAAAARQTGLKLGDKFRPTHEIAGERSHHKHGAFTIVGILKPTGTPNDNALFVNIEGFYRVGGHAGKFPGSEAQARRVRRLPQRKARRRPRRRPADPKAGPPPSPTKSRRARPKRLPRKSARSMP